MGDSLCSVKPGFVCLFVCSDFFFAPYIFKGTCFLFHISTDSALWEDAGTRFANVTFFLLEAYVTMSVAAVVFPL